MAVIKMKPTSPGRRGMVKVTRDTLHKGAGYAPLLEPQFHKSQFVRKLLLALKPLEQLRHGRPEEARDERENLKHGSPYEPNDAEHKHSEQRRHVDVHDVVHGHGSLLALRSK